MEKMERRLSAFTFALFITGFFSSVLSEDPQFPTTDELIIESYTTEVIVTDVNQELSAYAIEYFDKLDDWGSVKVSTGRNLQSVYYDNSTFELLEVNETNCKRWDADDSIYSLESIFYGWLNKEPLVIGPSAALWFAQNYRSEIIYKGNETVRDIPCDKFSLLIKGPRDNMRADYYFAPKDWATPYKMEGLRVPIRVHFYGNSSKEAEQPDDFVLYNLVNDFLYFKPTISDKNDLQPPIGIGCPLRNEADDKPDIPKVFQFAAEMVDLMSAKEHEDIPIEFQRTWYDYEGLMARFDRYSRKDGYVSKLFDFKTGAQYIQKRDGSCQVLSLRNTQFEIYDVGMVGRMKEAKEVLYLDGTLYSMGKRKIRGIQCNAYETVLEDEWFEDQKYSRLVVTAYFTKASTNVGTDGEEESRIPVYILINGWSTPNNNTLQKQYNIYGFKDVIWPEMYSSFNLQRCYTKAESKAYFVLILAVRAEDAARMEDQYAIVEERLRVEIAKHAKVSEIRIPFLKVDYKPTGVFATGLMLERPPALLQFYLMDSGPTVTNDPYLKASLEAETLEECSYACVDEGEFPCKGFYFCGQACFLKSTDPFEVIDTPKETDLGICDEYIRTERESTNFRETYLEEALKNLEDAVFNQSVPVSFDIPGGTETVNVQDIVIGEGPFTSADAGDKPYLVSIKLRKLDRDGQSTSVVADADSLHTCYKRCKEVGSLCSSFSYCDDPKKTAKECIITSTLVIDGVTDDRELIPDAVCNIYILKFLDYFTAYPEKVSLIAGDKVIRSVQSTQECAQNCRLETDFVCRGFEFCRSLKTCTLHSKHILDLKPGETGTSTGGKCVHFAAQYIADYMDMGRVLIDDNSNVRYGTSLEECAKICSEELKEKCKSFNYCPQVDFTDSTCSLSLKLLRDDGIATTEKGECQHFEKRNVVHDWDSTNKKALEKGGYTSKSFAGLVVGMLILGLVVGVLGFVFYSYMRSRSSNEGMTVRFMKQET